jgi:hypothetical protein
MRNSPSSNTWVKFEDSDEVRETTNAPFSSSFINVRNEHKESLSTESIQRVAKEYSQDQQEMHFLIPQSDARKSDIEDNSSLSFKRNGFPNRSRYAAFDFLRFGRDKNTHMGWSTYLLGEGEGEGEQ